MFMAISAEGPGASDLSYVVQKHPAKVFEKGNLRLLFTKNEPERASMAVMVEFDEFKLWNQDTPDADAYVSSREYALSSLFCREVKKALNTAISGNYKDPADKERAERPMDMIIDLLPFATALTDEQIAGLLRPLGYRPYDEPVVVGQGSLSTFQPVYAVDHSFQLPWMPQRHRALELALRCRKTVRQVLRELLVLIPVIDNYTHYTEFDTLVAELKNYGEGWLDAHPKKDFITSRFLRHSRKLIKEFDGEEKAKEGEGALEKRIFLSEMRTKWFVDTVKALGVRSVVDAGCGNGRLAAAFNAAGVLQVSAFDCHFKAVQTAKWKLENKANVFFSSLMYRDDRLMGKDAIVLQEVIEHLPEFQFNKAVDLIFRVYRPKWVLMSTPNRSYNPIFGLPAGRLRHRDHKFEWNEEEALAFGKGVEYAHGYQCSIEPIGKDYVPPTEAEKVEMAARDEALGKVRVIESAKPLHVSVDLRGGSASLAVEVAPQAVVHTDIAPTFGFVFTRKD